MEQTEQSIYTEHFISLLEMTEEELEKYFT